MSDMIGSAEIRAGRLKFDPVARVVEVAGRRTMLDARSSRVFLALAEQFGDCVTKDALMHAGWPTQLVHENSLSFGAWENEPRGCAARRVSLAAFLCPRL